ncbi:hypothetical protein [Nostoc sp. FACHB-133]|nr:hypothetical protein [Nostoc sp. FACHB-133]MBD2525076.1 hypothetical protein [Nostoc sp. FACHB-133]
MIRSDVLSAIALGIYPKLSALSNQPKSDRYTYQSDYTDLWGDRLP